MAWTRRPRTGHPGMGGLVQPPAARPRPRPHPTRRIREEPLPSNRVRPSGRDSHDRACMKPGEVQFGELQAEWESVVGKLESEVVSWEEVFEKVAGEDWEIRQRG